MSVNGVSNQPPAPTQLSPTAPTGDVALTGANFAGLTELWLVTMITVSVSKVINDACSGPFGNLISTIQHQQYMDQAWEAAINSAVTAAGSDADESTSVTLPISVTLADGTTSYLADYLAERPNLASSFQIDNADATIRPQDLLAGMKTLTQSNLTVSDYYQWVSGIQWQINTYGDPSTLPPEPTSPALPSDPNAPLPPNYLSYANTIGALGISQLSKNPQFLYQDTYTITVGESKSTIADINTSATNYMTTLQQLTNTLNNMISALATFCTAIAKCQQAVSKTPWS